MRLLADPERVVEHHPAASEHPRKHLMLRGCRFDAVPITHLHTADSKADL